MALRLSSLLMHGVVIVCQSKVNFLHDDAMCLLREIKAAYKAGNTPPPDRTRLPIGKYQAKYKAVTLSSPNCNDDLEDSGKWVSYSNGNIMMDFQQTSFISVRLDDFDDDYLHQNLEDDLSEDHHQAEPAHITIDVNYDQCWGDFTTLNNFERFDIEEEDVAQFHYTPDQELQEQHEHKSDENKEVEPNQGLKRKRVSPMVALARRRAAMEIEDGQVIISNEVYESWIEDTSEIVLKRTRLKKKPKNALSMMKMGTRMKLPSIVITENLIATNGQVHYAAPLLETFTITPPSKTPFVEPNDDGFKLEIPPRVEDSRHLIIIIKI
ncbi:hypothetical protein ACP275_06G035800 [Erythranthe tilingii]